MEKKKVKVHGHEIAVYSYGEGPNVLFLVAGPGFPSNYLRDSHQHLAYNGYRIIAWDSLGCGESDKPKEKYFWQFSRFVEEIEVVRKELSLGKINLLGHSWGGLIALEYCFSFPQFVKKFIAANTAFHLPLMQKGFDRIKLALGNETIAMMARREAEGSTQHPEYQGALNILKYRHLCRMDDWPESLHYSINNCSIPIYSSLFGKNFFNCSGMIREYNKIYELHKLKMPCLIVHGEHDNIISEVACLARDQIEESKLVIFRNCSHTPFFEDPDSYFKILHKFIVDQNER